MPDIRNPGPGYHGLLGCSKPLQVLESSVTYDVNSVYRVSIRGRDSVTRDRLRDPRKILIDVINSKVNKD